MGVEETEKEPAVAQGAPEAPNGLEDPEAKRAKKAAKRERQRLKKQQQKEQQEAAEPDPFAELASRRLRVPLSSFMPSTTRRQLEQPAQKARRRRGFGGAYIEYNGMLEQVKLLQCPLVWRLRPLGPVNELYSILDSAPYCGSPWHSAVEQIQVASDFAEQRMLWKSRELLQDVYAMLEDQDVNAQKSMFRKYLPGLKHVLDATWLLVREDADARAGRRLPDGTLADDVVLFEELDDQQRACVYAIKAVMAQVDVEAADKALQLDPGEAQWHYVKWLCLRAARARKRGVEPEDLTTSTPQEEAVLRKAHELRQTPQTMVATARACLEGPRKDAEQCARLLGEAKALFPRCAYVHFHCGHLYHRLVRGKKNAKSKRDAEVKRDTQKVILSFKRAIHLSQGLWMKACLDWGMYCLENGMSHEGMYHLRKAGVLD